MSTRSMTSAARMCPAPTLSVRMAAFFTDVSVSAPRSASCHSRALTAITPPLHLRLRERPPPVADCLTFLASSHSPKLPHQQYGVQAAEGEGIREGDADPLLPRLVRNVV